MALRKVCAAVPRDRRERDELDQDLRRMGCIGLFQHPWRIRQEEVVRELVTGAVPVEFANTIRGRPTEWTVELWNRVYGFHQGEEDLVDRKADCTTDRFTSKMDSKYGYRIADCKDGKERRMLAFLVPILNPGKPSHVTLTMASTLLLALERKRVINWGQLIRDVVHRLAQAAKRSQPAYVSTYLFHLYYHASVLTVEEDALWEAHQIMIELETTDSEPEEPEEVRGDVVVVSDGEEPAPKKRKRVIVEGSPSLRTRAATRAAVAGPSRMSAGENPVDPILRDLEEVRSRMAAYELTMQQIEGMVGNPPREGLVAAVRQRIDDPLQTRELAGRVKVLTAENQKLTKKLTEVEAEREQAVLVAAEASRAFSQVQEVLGAPGEVWAKARMLDAQLEKDGHIPGSKIIAFLLTQGAKLEVALGAMRSLVATITEKIPGVGGSAEEDDSFSGYSDLGPKDLEELGQPEGEQRVEEVEIPLPPPIPAPIPPPIPAPIPTPIPASISPPISATPPPPVSMVVSSPIPTPVTTAAPVSVPETVTIQISPPVPTFRVPAPVFPPVSRVRPQVPSMAALRLGVSAIGSFSAGLGQSFRVVPREVIPPSTSISAPPSFSEVPPTASVSHAAFPLGPPSVPGSQGQTGYVEHFAGRQAHVTEGGEHDEQHDGGGWQDWRTDEELAAARAARRRAKNQKTKERRRQARE